MNLLFIIAAAALALSVAHAASIHVPPAASAPAVEANEAGMSESQQLQPRMFRLFGKTIGIAPETSSLEQVAQPANAASVLADANREEEVVPLSAMQSGMLDTPSTSLMLQHATAASTVAPLAAGRPLLGRARFRRAPQMLPSGVGDDSARASSILEPSTSAQISNSQLQQLEVPDASLTVAHYPHASVSTSGASASDAEAVHQPSNKADLALEEAEARRRAILRRENQRREDRRAGIQSSISTRFDINHVPMPPVDASPAVVEAYKVAVRQSRKRAEKARREKMNEVELRAYLDRKSDVQRRRRRRLRLSRNSAAGANVEASSSNPQVEELSTSDSSA